ncbi:MAG: BamA/TamA family outer membrane protein [Bacteroidales bacterium]|nr:BamA/TamA family outer membrane protein [Bacteroidales bacterium]
MRTRPTLAQALGLSLALALTLLAAACSTTAMLGEGESRLSDNKVMVVGNKHKGSGFSPSSLQPYIKQKAGSSLFGSWQPSLYVYNWQNGKGGWWDRFCQKVGQPPVVFDESLVDASVASMIDHLEFEGWYNSTIEPEVSIKNKKAKVLYKVTLGKRFPINGVEYRVRDTAVATLLHADSMHFALKPGNPLSEADLDAESERLSQYFRNNGYWGFSKNYFFFYADTTTVRDSAALIVAIEDYTRNENPENARPHRKYDIGNVALIPQPGMRVRPKFLHNLNQLKPGEPYSEDAINRTYNRISSIPLFSSVNMLLRESPADSTAVDVRVLLQQARLQALKLNLEGSFNSIGLLGVAPSLSYSHKNLFGGGEVLSLGFRGNFQFMLNSPLRANEFSVSTGLGIPWYPEFVWKMPRINLPQIDVNFSYSYQNRPEYVRNILSGTFGVSWNIDRHFYYQIYPLQLSAVRTSHMEETFLESLTDPYLANSFVSHLDLGGGGMFYYTTNSTVNPKETYFYTRFQFDISGNTASLFSSVFNPGSRGNVQKEIMGVPYSQYVRGEVQAVETIRLGKDNEYALALRALAGAGFAYGNSLALPFEKLFYAGGAGSMRGWRARAVGPGMAPRDTMFKIVNQPGDMHLEANVEFRFPIVSKLNGAVFVDAGNVWNVLESSDAFDGLTRDPLGLFTLKNLLRSTALDWGLGLRLDFGMVLVRLDYGMQLYDPGRQRWYGINDWVFDGRSALHFGIGYPF